jgi:hypothetical protein
MESQVPRAPPDRLSRSTAPTGKAFVLAVVTAKSRCHGLAPIRREETDSPSAQTWAGDDRNECTGTG